jgi:hypothetical protein
MMQQRKHLTGILCIDSVKGAEQIDRNKIPEGSASSSAHGMRFTIIS